MREEFKHVAVFAAAVAFVFVIIIAGQLKLSKKVEKIQHGANVYCPSLYKHIKGDGFSAYDSSSPLTRTLINVTRVHGDNIFNDKNEVFKIHECIIED